jgi:hypothetical protein
VVDLEEVKLFGAYEGKRQAVVLDLQASDAAEDNPRVQAPNKGNECKFVLFGTSGGRKGVQMFGGHKEWD